MTRDDIRGLLERVRDTIGFDAAVAIVRTEGHANHLVHVAEEHFGAMRDKALMILGEGAHIEIADGIMEAATALKEAYNAFIATEQTMSDAKTRLGAAVDTAVAEMSKAADFIKNHPAANDDPELGAMADRLSAAATALSGVDGTVDNTGGTDTGSGTVSG